MLRITKLVFRGTVFAKYLIPFLWQASVTDSAVIFILKIV